MGLNVILIKEERRILTRFEKCIVESHIAKESIHNLDYKEDPSFSTSIRLFPPYIKKNNALML